MNMYKFYCIFDIVENFYKGLKEVGLDVLFDDCKECFGVMFNDMELLGVFFIFVIGECNLDENKVEFKNCCIGEKLMLDLDIVVVEIIFLIKG